MKEHILGLWERVKKNNAMRYLERLLSYFGVFKSNHAKPKRQFEPGTSRKLFPFFFLLR
jgi:hypothetical protein